MESLGSGLLLSVLASWLVVTLSLLSIVEIAAAAAATRSFSFVNECPHEVWVGTQANGGIRLLAEGGFALPAGQKMTLDQVEAGWGGRFWGRTGCTFDAHGRGSCETGDCGGFLKCAGAGGEPPASLAEFTLNGANGDDFYDVSLVDGYNLEIRITPTGGNGTCGSPGCTSNLNTQCPTSLQVLSAGDVVACKSACAAFGTPQYCCTDAYGSPTKCPPTRYSKLFKSACPTAYSYAYDDASSTFTCSGANYQINFCSSSNSGSSPVTSESSTGDSPLSSGGDGSETQSPLGTNIISTPSRSAAEKPAPSLVACIITSLAFAAAVISHLVH
ncbi:hypothetical protein BDL97_14G082700 [Sphagnum fallax]|nr:hypothetical protein BDL97_14G082700 [Sphagnum fallax]